MKAILNTKHTNGEERKYEIDLPSINLSSIEKLILSYDGYNTELFLNEHFIMEKVLPENDGNIEEIMSSNIMLYRRNEELIKKNEYLESLNELL